MQEILDIFESQKKFHFDGNTKSIDFRVDKLKKLKLLIKENEDKIIKALQKDLGKSAFETYATEIGMVYDEINSHIKNIRKWSKRERKKTPISHFPAKSYVYKEPYGVTLIISPFNYPFQLLISPLVGAISAGNCAMLKPSSNTPHIAVLLQDIISNTFEKNYIAVVSPLGGRESISYLLDLNFDYIFFTGSVNVGKVVMEKAAKNLTPVTLELGGKSPCIVDKDANIELSAKRIVWGKMLNAGQTCVAPDYLYVHKSVKDVFLKAVVKEIRKQFGENIKDNKDFTRIVNIQAMNRLLGYMEDGDIYFGGDYDIESLYIEPTIITNLKDGNKVMQEEIFGPIFPVLEFDNLNEAIEYINLRDKPLALYYFSENRDNIEKILKSTSAGGVTINDTVIHVASHYLPFGGVGNSGMGSCHGKASFDTFSHSKSVMKRGTFMELPIRFAPYKDKIKYMRMLMK